MKKNETATVSWISYEKTEELPGDEQELAGEALKAASDAYAPYSGFCVGVALKLEDGTVVRGVNVENAAFPSGICAERNAIASIHASKPGIRPLMMAVCALGSDGRQAATVSPCGNCRQVLSEEEYIHGKPMKLILCGAEGIKVFNSASDLLPLHFSKKDLGH